MGNSTGDNTFGAPVKGALMAAEKSTLGTDNVKTEVVVPQLFVASDYNAGLYIYGQGQETYVYYGTPNTAKDSSGAIANYELTFKRTRLDGEKDQAFFTVDSISTEYRMVEIDSVVYIVYYDTADSSLKSYNTSDNTFTTIAKTDQKVEGKNGVSLNKYHFADNDDLTSAVVYYTVTVYNQKYYEQDAQEDGYERAKATYNYVYAYKPGDVVDTQSNLVGTKVLDGQSTNTTYEIIYCKDGYTVYTETDINSRVENYITESVNIGDKTLRNKVNDVNNVTSTMYIVSENEIYFVDTESKNVQTTTLVGDETNAKKAVTLLGDATSILFKKGDMIYYYNTSTQISRVRLSDEDAKAERVSSDTAATTWFKPEIVQVGGAEYLFYCDNSGEGNSYIAYVDLNGQVEDIDTNLEDEVYNFVLKGNSLIGKILAEDKARAFTSKVGKLPSGELEFTIEDDKIVIEEVTALREAYNNLTNEEKSFVKQDTLDKLINAEKSIILANKLYMLEGVSNYETCTEEQKTAYDSAYNQVKEYLKLLDGEGVKSAVLDRVQNNLKANMSKYEEILDI